MRSIQFMETIFIKPELVSTVHFEENPTYLQASVLDELVQLVQQYVLRGIAVKLHNLAKNIGQTLNYSELVAFFGNSLLM